MSARAINERILEASLEKADQLMTAYTNGMLSFEEFSQKALSLVDCIKTNAPHLVNQLADLIEIIESTNESKAN